MAGYARNDGTLFYLSTPPVLNLISFCYIIHMRKIIHIDMDCFYAAVEMRDDPSLANKPIAIGGSQDQRGVLCTANYEARRYGLHAAMSTAMAFRRCPQLILLPVRMNHYRAISAHIRYIFEQYTKMIEPLSLDEAYLDVTGLKVFQGSAYRIAQAIRAQILEETGLTASAGISCNKLLAKVASDWHKPNGQFLITPGDVADFMLTLPVKKLPGVGKVSQAKLAQMDVHTCGDLQTLDPVCLHKQFGSFAARLRAMAYGQDERALVLSREAKTMSVEHTFRVDLHTIDEAIAALPELMTRLTQRLEKNQQSLISKQFIKVKFSDFKQTTVEASAQALDEAQLIALLEKAYARESKPIRLIGIGVGFLEGNDAQQVFEFS